MAEDEQLGDLFVLDDPSITTAYGVDPTESIMSFNAALAAARPRGASNMLPARLGDPPGGHSSTDSDVMEILLALRKEVRVLSDKVNGKGF
ncbi:hypothetical protein CYMTET_13724 [Cymbomonas tetramitiformis]|uniref:Uncharacterized protein n=1 Tax=Cymbomonas tetramitiformis TaxID=36881 RepID=A0AAE0GHX0_9CHLO|nr:hypothetical protein CYMTET_13724 [Cymbomonas tetramitiformis]